MKCKCLNENKIFVTNNKTINNKLKSNTLQIRNEH